MDEKHEEFGRGDVSRREEEEGLGDYSDRVKAAIGRDAFPAPEDRKAECRKALDRLRAMVAARSGAAAPTAPGKEE